MPLLWEGLCHHWVWCLLNRETFRSLEASDLRRGMGTRLEMERFDGNEDFGLWKIKMKAILTQQKVDLVIAPPTAVPSAVTKEKLKDMDKIAHSLISLHLDDKVLRKLSGEETVDKLWELEQMDVKTTLLHGEAEETIYMNQQLGFVALGQESKGDKAPNIKHGSKTKGGSYGNWGDQSSFQRGWDSIRDEPLTSHDYKVALQAGPSKRKPRRVTIFFS